MKQSWRSFFNRTFWMWAGAFAVLAVAACLCVGYVTSAARGKYGSTVNKAAVEAERIQSPEEGVAFHGLNPSAEDTPPFFTPQPQTSTPASLYLVIALLFASCVLFLLMTYTPSSDASSMLDRFSSYRADARDSRLPLALCGEKAIGALLGGVMVMAVLRLLYSTLSGGPSANTIWNGIIAMIIAVILLYAIIYGYASGMLHFVVVFLLITPVLAQAWSPLNQQSLFWPVCGLLLGLFAFPRQTARRYLYVFYLLQYVYILVSLFTSGGMPSSAVLWEQLILLFFGCGAYVSMDIYIAYTMKNQSELMNASARLEEAQAVYTQKEKMAALGQLISGVAHEINTPIGAIKASSENMDSSARSMFFSLITKTRGFTDSDIDDFLTLTDICSRSVREMRNTMEMRRAKPQLMTFFNRIDPASARRVVDLLAKMEICGMEKIETHIDIFKNPRLIELLELVLVVFPYLNATQNIQFATSRVSKIVFALKSYSHTSLENEYVIFDLIANLSNILVLYHNQIKYGVEVIRDFDEDIPPMYGNPDELGQVWSNLVQNAIQAMNGVGTLTIRIKKISSDAIKLVFKDTGGGIKQEHIDRMFEVFFTTKPPGEGSGLGLNICKRIVEKHGGTIVVDNKPGQGVAFIVTLPIKTVPETHGEVNV